MTEMCEGVAVVVEMMDKDAKCEFQPEGVEWKCKLEGQSESLRKNLTDHCGIPEPMNVASIADVTERAWPSQAHHLIPWQQLKKHQVTQWLAESPPAGTAKIYHDNNYSVDHGLNGKFMPYSASLKEWSGASAAKKKQISEKVMAMAGIQLHQGKHSFKNYGTGESGYKTRVAEYLDAIHANSVSHYAPVECDDCKGKKQANKYPPRKNIVRYLDCASGRLEVDINLGRIYVSRRAATFASEGGVMY